MTPVQNRIKNRIKFIVGLDFRSEITLEFTSVSTSEDHIGANLHMFWTLMKTNLGDIEYIVLKVLI